MSQVIQYFFIIIKSKHKKLLHRDNLWNKANILKKIIIKVEIKVNYGKRMML